MRNLTDSHFHSLALQKKGINPVAVVTKCQEAGMAEMIEVGLLPEDLETRRALFDDVSGVFFSSGFAPAEAAGDDWNNRIKLLEAQAQSGKIVAIGELGLDWHWNYGTKASQIALMEAQLEVAKVSMLPVIIHNREADAELFNILKQANLPAAGVMHCFSSDYEMAARCIDLGYAISFAGNVTYKNAQDIYTTAKRIPIDSLLLETDAPFLSPQAVRGSINTPANIVHTYDFVADARRIANDYLANKVRENLCKLINLEPPTDFQE